MVFYRPHETWTTRADWRTQLPEGEDVVGKSISPSAYCIPNNCQQYRSVTLSLLSQHRRIMFEYTLCMVHLFEYSGRRAPQL